MGASPRKDNDAIAWHDILLSPGEPDSDDGTIWLPLDAVSQQNPGLATQQSQDELCLEPDACPRKDNDASAWDVLLSPGEPDSDDSTNLLPLDAVSQQNPGLATQQSQDELCLELVSMDGEVGAGMCDLPSCPDYDSQQKVPQTTSAELHSNQQGCASQESADAPQNPTVLIDNQSWQYKGFQEWIFKELLKHRDGISQLEVRTSNFKYSEISQRKLSTSDPHECSRQAYIVHKGKDHIKKKKQPEDDNSECSGTSTPEPSTINMPYAKSARSFSHFPPPLIT